MSTKLAEGTTLTETGTVRRRPRFRPGASPMLVRTLLILVGLLVWETVSRTELVNPVFLPPPTAIVAAGAGIIGDPQVAAAFRITGLEVGVAFVIAVTTGMCAGMLLGLVKLLRDAFLGPLLFMLSTPKSIFLPLFLLFFGLGTTAKIAFGAFSAFFYVTTNVVGGVGLLRDHHKRLARAFQAPLSHYLRDMVIPSALPGIFTALWFGLRQTIIGVLIAELFASDGGIGYLIKIYTNQFRTDRTLAVVFLLSLLAILGGSLWDRLERRLQRWRVEAHT